MLGGSFNSWARGDRHYSFTSLWSLISTLNVKWWCQSCVFSTFIIQCYNHVPLSWLIFDESRHQSCLSSAFNIEFHTLAPHLLHTLSDLWWKCLKMHFLLREKFEQVTESFICIWELLRTVTEMELLSLGRSLKMQWIEWVLLIIGWLENVLVAAASINQTNIKNNICTRNQPSPQQ